MSTQLQIRRDTAVDLLSATPVEAEIGYDQTNKNLLVGDGARSGGIPHPSYSQIQNQRFIFGTAGGTGDVITLALNEDLDAYAAGVAVEFIATAANTGAVTLNVSGLGAKDLKSYTDGAEVDLEADNISTGQIVRAVYDGTNFQINLGGGGGLKPIATTNVTTSVASVPFNSVFTSGNSYEVIISNLTPALDNRFIEMFVSDDGGSTWKSTLYIYVLDGTEATASASAAQWYISGGGVGSTGSEGYSAHLMITDPANASFPTRITGTANYTSDGGGLVSNSVSLARGALEAIDSIKFEAQGNIENAQIAIYERPLV